MRGQKGITLVALIITIIVLLILAVVAIAAVQDSGVIQHAGNAVNTYNQGAADEWTELGNYVNYLKDHMPATK